MSKPAHPAESVFAPIAGPRFSAPELPTYDALMECIRCGRCLPACPTYQQTTLETFSPRGRLSLMRAVEDGKLDLADAGLEKFLYHCLDCRACNTVCPVSIPIGELIVEGRCAVAEKHRRPWIIRFVLQHVLISPRRVQKFTPPLRLAQMLKVDKLMAWLPPFKDLMQLAPQLPKPLWSEMQKQRISDKANQRTYRVGYFLGCVMNVVFAEASRATVKLLEHYGCEVITPQDQMCCGTPQDDQGMKDVMRQMAKRNIAAFEALGDLDAIVADCAACSGFLKEYRRVFRDDVVWAERADRFASKVRDITEWLDQIMPADLPAREKSGVRAAQWVAYHEPCHLANVQSVRKQPRALIGRLKGQGIELRELSDSTRCCGSAGIYNLTHPAMSKDLLDRKMADVQATGAEVVISANPGCLLQLEWGAKRTGSSVKVKHVTQILLETMEDGRNE